MSGLRRLLVSVVLAVLVIGGFSSPAAARAYDETEVLWKWVPNGIVEDVVVRGSRVYIGGEFTSLTNVVTGETVIRSHLAKLSTAGGLFRGWNPRANQAVRALALNSRGTQLYVGGDFTRIDGARRARVAAVTAARGRLVSGWRARANDTVLDLAVRSGRLYLGGEFSRIDGVIRRRVGALARDDGDLIRSFRAHTDGRVRTLETGGTTLYLGGDFTKIRNSSRTFLGAVSVGKGEVRSWQAPVCPDCVAMDLDVYQGGVYVGLAGPSGGRLRAYNAVTGAQLWSVIAGGDVQAVAVSGSRVYAGGHFEDTFDGQPRTMLAAVARGDGDVIAGFVPSLTADRPGINALAAGTTHLFAVGGFAAGALPDEPHHIAVYPAL